jgi:transposase
MIQITPQMRVLVATEPVDFRRGIDGLAAICRSVLSSDPFSGTVFVFRSRSGKAIRLLVFDGQGYWLATKRLSTGRFQFWPVPGKEGEAASTLAAHQLQVLLSGGDPAAARGAPEWRRVSPPA